MITLQNWRARMSEDMRLRDFRLRTQDRYLLATRLFIEHVGREPESLTDVDVRKYFLFLREERKLSPSTINVTLHALRFFFIHTMLREWAIFDLLRVNLPRLLPVVLSTHEVRALLAAVHHPVRRMALTTLYALGLRITEGLALETSHIDSSRLTVWIRDGKGGVDRGVPLPKPLLLRLRDYWKSERPASTSKLLFVSENAKPAIDESTIQKTFIKVREQLRMQKHATPHTLRHSYATHLIEAGISMRTVQQLLGHKSLRTTEQYMHVTQPGTERLQHTLDQLMAGL